MVLFTLSIENATQNYLHLSATFPSEGASTEIQLPSWRPGRYELGNFAKNVRNFKVYDEHNKALPFQKITKDRWKVNSGSAKEVRVDYLYYAAELNAGSTFLSPTQLYVNPVNCCVYTDSTFDSAVALELKVPENWQFAGSLEADGGKWMASNFDELFDSPFICSPSMQHNTYLVDNTTFHLWFQGECKPEWEKMIGDFQKFTEWQVRKFSEFHVKDYHFLIQVLPVKAYHGVEHSKSTVLLLGPSYDLFADQYTELLGLASHELYHAWNVKSIRPIELFPYDFTQENYSRLGFLCEGVTTYEGDHFLLKSGVFSDKQFFIEFNKQLQKHFDNPGRFNYSVADSSFDTWLDGYNPGVPARKVSIYTEGCLLAFVTDVRIRRATKNKYGIDEVMKRLYFSFALQNKGVSEEDYRAVVEAVSGESFDDFFRDFVYGTDPYESIITDALDYLGLELVVKPSDSYAESRLGMKVASSSRNFRIMALYPGGPAETAGLMLGDEIAVINGCLCNNELDKWLKYFDADAKRFTVVRDGMVLDVTLPEVQRNFFMKYEVKAVENPNGHQKAAYEAWKK
jgi:predicted metalloprotease with PDZ domain